MSIDKSLEKFISLRNELEQYSEEISEADTRCKFLDKIFIDVLGWKEENITREGYAKPGYFDYEFSTPQYRFVVEAKKIKEQFNLPDKGNKIKIKTLYTNNKQVIDQIRDYIIKRNLSYGIISNGQQFIVSRFVNTDGTDWLNNDAFYFNGLDSIKKDFVTFYNFFSFEMVVHNGRIKIYKEEIIGKSIVDNKILKRKNDEVIRNEFGDAVVSIIGQIFSEIYKTDELDNLDKLSKCYVPNEDVKLSNSKLNILFSDEPPSFDSRILPVQNTENTQEQISSEIIKPIGPTPEPVIIIGSKGAGKTTFIKYFTEVKLEESIKRDRPIIYIDFRFYTKQQIEDTKGIYSKIYRQLIEKYDFLNLTQLNVLKTIYQKEIKENLQGIWSYINDDEKALNQKISDFIEKKIESIDSHLANITTYLLKFHRKRLTIILDNADQLEDNHQRELFLLAQSIRSNLNSLVIISLREGYFFQWKNKPPFDAYQSNVFHITAPPYREVLKKRIDFVLNNFDFNRVDSIYKNKYLLVGSSSIKNLFINLSNSIFHSGNSELIEFLEETSFPNIRDGLELFNTFLVSGHTKIANYITSPDYRIPIWEFTKSIALESRYYYKSEFSRIKNLFRPCINNKNHFTKIRLLIFLQNIAEQNSYKTSFVIIEEILDLFCKSGYTNDCIIEELNMLLNFKLIESKGSESDIEKEISLTSETEIRITQSGNFYLTDFINRFHYIDLILQDTPIFDDYYFERLKDTFPEVESDGKRDIRERLINVGTFIEYLRKMELQEHSKNELNHGHKALDLNIIDYIEQTGLKEDISRISGKK